MAQKTIPELNPVTSFDENALFVIDDTAQTFKITAANVEKSLKKLRPYFASTGSADATLTPLDKIIRISGAHTITLPDGDDCEMGDEFIVKKMDSGTTTTIVFQSGQSADGETTLTLTEQFSFFRFMWNGTGWDIVGQG